MNPTIANVQTSGVQGRIGSAIASAAQRNGVDFNYLYHQARLESGFNPDARARSSSATGLYQFLDQTWLAMVDQHGEENGLGWASQAVQRNSNGRYTVSDPQLRQQILDLRRNPEAAASMAAAYASDNREHLEGRLGRPMQAVDLYMAHFLGAGGATRFLRAAAETPDASAAASFPNEARANRPIFYTREGRARSFAEIRDFMGDRLSVGDRTMTASAPTVTRRAGDYNQMASALLDPEELAGEGGSSAARMRMLAGGMMPGGMMPNGFGANGFGTPGFNGAALTPEDARMAAARLAYMTLADLDGNSDLGALS